MNTQDYDDTDMSKIEKAMLSREWITVRNAADQMGLSLSSIYRLIEDGTLVYQISGKKRFVSIASCLEYLGPEAAKAMGLAPKSMPPIEE